MATTVYEREICSADASTNGSTSTTIKNFLFPCACACYAWVCQTQGNLLHLANRSTRPRFSASEHLKKVADAVVDFDANVDVRFQ